MEVSFPQNQAVPQPSTEAHSVSYKLLGIQRGTEPHSFSSQRIFTCFFSIKTVKMML